MSKILIVLIVYAVLICIGLPLIIKYHRKNKNILFEVLSIIFMPIVLLVGLFVLI